MLTEPRDPAPLSDERVDICCMQLTADSDATLIHLDKTPFVRIYTVPLYEWH